MGIGIVEDIRRAVTADFKKEGNAIVLVGETQPEFGGSLYSRIAGMKSSHVPRTSPERLRTYANAMLEALQSFKVHACHDLAEGGLAVAIAEMCIASGLGVDLDLSPLDLPGFVKLFSESNTRWLVEVGSREAEKFVEFFKERQLKAEIIGFVSGHELMVKDENGRKLIDVEIEKLDDAWRNGLARFLG